MNATVPGLLNSTRAQDPAVLCKPTREDVLKVCTELPFGCPAPGIHYNIIDMIRFSVPCVGQACEVAKTLREHDRYFVYFLAGWVVAFVVFKSCFELRLKMLQERLFNH